jgi:hypothetical protein
MEPLEGATLEQSPATRLGVRERVALEELNAAAIL